MSAQKTNYDIIYSKEFDKIYEGFFKKAISAFKNKTEKKPYIIRNELIDPINEHFKALTMKNISPMNYSADMYTNDLLGNFKNHYDDYTINPVTNFINEYFQEIKDRNKSVNHNIPKNFNLNPKQTVEFLAKHDAMKLFIDRMYFIHNGDNLEICEQKISRKGYTPQIIPALKTETEHYHADSDDDEQKKKLKKEFTLSRQILAIKYLFKLINHKGIYYDDTKMGEFVRFLTGRELGAIDIRDATIYKKILSKAPARVNDLRYIKGFFEDLHLKEIVDIIDKEIDSATKK